MNWTWYPASRFLWHGTHLVVGGWIFLGLIALVVMAWRGVQGRSVFFSLVTFLVGVALLAFGSWILYREHLFEGSGAEKAEAIVTDRLHETINQRVGYVPVGNINSYYLDYAYTVGGISHQSVHQQVNEQTWNYEASRGTVPIEYVVSDPQTNRIDLPTEKKGRRGAPWIVLAGGVLFVLLSLRWGGGVRSVSIERLPGKWEQLAKGGQGRTR